MRIYKITYKQGDKFLEHWHGKLYMARHQWRDLETTEDATIRPLDIEAFDVPTRTHDALAAFLNEQLTILRAGV
ncbi:hypothetical protein [Candidimonas nitroreducens]|uniref:Uncharacterized protein n=1 Tax=Candidimonas nitroreducens TaxID=683354 RepID=A0A225LVI6_9BURK|nr:hypothetical protein [Candidimonas nitroreducens]OWT53384.1 hypothetical protein CEY11_24840 [Candidimonas nitroreducens]